MHQSILNNKTTIVHSLFIFTIIVNLFYCDMGSEVFQSHSYYINQTNIELVVSKTPLYSFDDYTKATYTCFLRSYEVFNEQVHFRNILDEYNRLVFTHFKTFKFTARPNQGIHSFLHAKWRNSQASDNENFFMS